MKKYIITLLCFVFGSLFALTGCGENELNLADCDIGYSLETFYHDEYTEIFGPPTPVPIPGINEQYTFYVDSFTVELNCKYDKNNLPDGIEYPYEFVVKATAHIDNEKAIGKDARLSLSTNRNDSKTNDLISKVDNNGIINWTGKMYCESNQIVSISSISIIG